MLQTKSITQKKIDNNSYLFINLVFSFFPVSFILGAFFVNANLLLFCCLGIYYLKSKVLKTKLSFPLKIIFLFFLIIFFSTALSFAKVLYLEGFENINTAPILLHERHCILGCFSPLAKLTKSILFFRFYLLLVIVYFLSQFDILRFKYFFLVAFFSSIIVSLDIIFQYIFDFNVIGLERPPHEFHNSGFFGNEYVAGGYILRFAFFAIFFSIAVFKNKNYAKFIFSMIVICIVGMGLLLSGNRMPLILFIFGLFLIFLLDLKIKKILLVSLIAMLMLFKLIISSNESFKKHFMDRYVSLIESVENTFLTPFDINFFGGEGIQKWGKTEILKENPNIKRKLTYEVKVKSGYLRLYLTAVDTWRVNKIFGNGIKSFRDDCGKLQITEPDLNLEEQQYPDKKNRLCSTHPHNYYFEILTETGIVGLIIISIVALLFMVFIFKNFKFVKQINIENAILLSAIISLFLETLPLRSTGSLFTTNNAAYLVLIGSILLSYKKILKIKIE